MRILPVVTKGYTVMVDDADFDTLTQYRWYVVKAGGKKNPLPYVATFVHRGDKKVKVFLHRLITQAPPELQVDHINHETLDNRRENLRLVTLQQNNQNRRANRGATSSFVGVHRHQGRWRADVGKKFVGMYDSEEDAARARDAAALQIFGSHAYQNLSLST